MKWINLVATVCGTTFGTPELAENIEMISESNGVEKTLILSVVHHESRCDPNALGESDDRGLMQVIPRWHWHRMQRLEARDLYNPIQNLKVGIDFLNSLEVQQDPVRALAFYNGGYNPPQWSYNYARKVHTSKLEYDKMLGPLRTGKKMIQDTDPE